LTIFHPWRVRTNAPSGNVALLTISLAAMAFACAGPTMVHALSERCPIRLGEAVVVQGSGPVGLAAAALAQLATAATVTLLGGPASRLELAAAVGIGDRHLNLVESDDQAAILAGLEGADLVIECTGVPHAVAQGLYLPRRGGDYLVVGQYTDAGPVAVNPHQIVYRQLNVNRFLGVHRGAPGRVCTAAPRAHQPLRSRAPGDHPSAGRQHGSARSGRNRQGHEGDAGNAGIAPTPT
jgi:threonine dehydrogenase-like Zn-dependent dehydrogenase